MAAAAQTDRPMSVDSPLGHDTLLLTSLSGHEGLSHLFSFHLEVLVKNGSLAAKGKSDEAVLFDRLLGQSITVRIKTVGTDKPRYFNGLCNRLSQGESDVKHTQFRLEVVPRLWLLTKRTHCRIFQNQTVPEILKDVLKNLAVTPNLVGKYEPRDFCVQYRETDFAFASRLMEEEGIFYFFSHAQGAHQLILGDSPQHHPEMAPAEIVYQHLSQADGNDTQVIYDWTKTQEVTAGKYTLWDHCFEIPDAEFEASKSVNVSVPVGKVTHTLQGGHNANLELYDWPGEYAQRFDGVDRGGGDRAVDLQKIYADGDRTATIRMQQEAAESVIIQGASNCRHLAAGHRFTLDTLPGSQLTKLMEAEGDYVLTAVTHSARQGAGYQSGDERPFDYHNSFTCIPAAQPFRPARTTAKPVIPGSQTAVVVGPPGEEIFCDKYGRVKVQFHWDRAQPKNVESSCWVRVGTVSAGKQWGAVHIPRVGQEVIVDFLEGDPDQPLIVGSVFNAEQMPAYKLPEERTKSYLKTNTSPGGKGFNELRFEDGKGKEQIFIHAQRNLDTRVLHDTMERVVHDRNLVVGYSKDEEQPDGSVTNKKGGDQREEVWQDKHLHVHRDHVEHVEGNVRLLIGKGEAEDGGNIDVVVEKDRLQMIMGNEMLHILKALAAQVDGGVTILLNNGLASLVKGNSQTEVTGDRCEKVKSQSLTVQGNQKAKVTGANHLQVGGDQNEKVGGTQSLTVAKALQEKVGTNYALEAGKEVHIKCGMKVILEAGAQLSLKGPGGFIDIGPSGVTIVGTIVNINSGGSAGSGSGCSPTAPVDPDLPSDISKNGPKDAADAKPAKPAAADDAKTGFKSNSGSE